MTRCPHCDAPLGSGHFCSDCGRPTEESPRRAMTSMIQAILGILLALLVVFSLQSSLERRPLRPARKGMTWAKTDHDPNFGTDLVGCSDCRMEVGDVSCKVALPILCLKSENLPNPGVSTNFYTGWAGGWIETTQPIRGDSLTSLSHANQICEQEIGTGYRMATGNDWNWYAYGNVNDQSRFWVYYGREPANCWD